MKYINPRLNTKYWLIGVAILFSVPAFCNLPDTLVGANNSTDFSLEKPAKKTGIYHVNYVVSGSIISIGLASDIIAIPRIKGKDDLSDAEINALNTDIINPIDKWGLRQDASQRTKYGHISDYYMSGVFLVPALLFLNKQISKEWGDIFMMYVEGHIITFSFYNYSPLGPTFNNKFRPVTYYTELPMADRQNGNNRNSFYSGHTASVSYTTFFMAKVYCDYHPDLNTGGRILAYSAALVPAAFEGYFRVKSLAHFPSDSMVGLALGVAVGIIVPELHKNRKQKLTVGMFDVPGGVGLSTSWKLN